MRPQRIFLVAMVCLGLPVLCWLATIAFTPAGMRDFRASVAANIRWLGLSPDGNRVATFVMLAVGIVGVIAMIKAVIIHNCGGLCAWGWLQVVVGLGLVAGGGFGWHLGHVALLWAIAMIITGWVLISQGANNIRLGRWMQMFTS